MVVVSSIVGSELGQAPTAAAGGFRLAVVMPVLNEAARLTQALAALGAAAGEGAHEVVVVDGGSADESPALARAAGATLVLAERGRARQMNAGVQALAPGWSAVLFLHADTRLPCDWSAQVHAALAAGAAWGRFDVRLDDPHPLLRLVGAMMNLRSHLTGICTGDQAIFVSAQVWARSGGYPCIALMEDIALSKRLKACAGRPASLRAVVRVSARRWRRHGILRTILLMWSLRLRYFLGESPESLHRRYYRS